MFVTALLNTITIKRYVPILVCCLSLAACGTGGGVGAAPVAGSAPAASVATVKITGLPIVSPSGASVINRAPTASLVAITDVNGGSVVVGDALVGGYVYSDVDGDVQGVSTFRWLRNGAAIPGAVTVNYAVTVADLGTAISFEVTPVAATGVIIGQVVASISLVPVNNSAPIASAVSINGSVTVGSTLSGIYTYSDADGDAEGTSTFRWLRDGVAITGATSPTYTLTPADIGTVVAPPVIPVGVKITFEVTPVAATGTLNGFPAVYAVTTKAKALHPVGTNLAEIKDWSNEIVFNDVFKRARRWSSVAAGNMQGNTNPIAVDANGWVTNLAVNQWVVSYIFFYQTGIHLPKGTYRCSYAGSGTISIRNATVLASGSGWMDIKFNNQSSYGVVSVIIKNTDPLNYIKDIKIQPLKADGSVNTATFRTDFLNRWRPFNVLRFMDWMNTNFLVRYKPQFATAINWADRPKVTDFSQATKNGVALEYMIELCNILKIDPWFNIPTTATDAYVTQFATMVKNKLDPALKAHVEYSNEVWNWGFPAAHYADTMGKNLGLGPRYEWIHFYTHRALQVLGIWKSVFGVSSTTRLVRVLSGQAMWVGLSTRILDYELAYTKIDAFAIAPYFGWDQNLVVSPVPPIATMFAAVDANLVVLNALFGQYALITNTRNVKLIAYEGGNGMSFPSNPALTAMATQMNRDPYMYTLYTRYLTNWSLAGGGLFMNFSSVIKPSKWGNWGVLEWYDLPVSSTSKYAAIKDALYRP